MADTTPVDELSREDLMALVREQQRQIAGLREEIERLKRAQRRQAAPFSKEKPGRKKGQGPFDRRQAPTGEPDITVEARLRPAAQTVAERWNRRGVEHVTTTGLPEQPKPHVTAYRVAICHCRNCGKKVRETAPGLAAGQYCATAHWVGPTVMAAAHTLHYGMGIPHRKVPAVRKELTGVSITQSVLTQDALRRRVSGANALLDLRTLERTKAFYGVDAIGGYSLNTKPEWLAEHPDAARRIARAMVRTLRWAREHPLEEVYAKLQPMYRSNDKQVDMEVLGIVISTLSTDGRMPPGGAEAMQRVASAADERVMKIDLASTYTNDFLEQK